MREMWQEMDGPCGDWDFVDDEMVYHGQKFECPRCGVSHVAGTDIPVRTFVIPDDGDMVGRDLPKDAAELAAWRAEIAR